MFPVKAIIILAKETKGRVEHSSVSYGIGFLLEILYYHLSTEKLLRVIGLATYFNKWFFSLQFLNKIV